MYMSDPPWQASSCTHAILARAVAAPLAVTIQTALLGKYGGSASQAAFAAVGTTANATCLLFNFLVDGISAKVCYCLSGITLQVIRCAC